LHELKIDKSFISDVPGNVDDEAIITSIIQLAASKQLKIVAEGVETQAQADYLNALYPDILQQGYLYGKPLPADEFEDVFVKPQANNRTA
jgi:sensor c-di-GMP phosphodiesterase-like protein